MMNKRLIILIMGIILLGSVVLISGIDELVIDKLIVDRDSIFTDLKINDVSNTESIFTIVSYDSEISSDALKVSFIEDCGNVIDYKILVNDTCINKIPVFESQLFCYINNKTLTKIDSLEQEQECEYKDVIIDYIYEKYSCYKEVDSLLGINDYKVIADVKYSTCDDGTFGYKIDWIPSLTINDVVISKDEWAWWNATFDYRENITIKWVGGDESWSNVKFELNNTNLNANFNFGNDGADIRIVNSTGDEQYFWLYYAGSAADKNRGVFNNDDKTWIYVNVTNLISSTDKLLTIYYGNNSEVETKSNGVKTFLVFDDFNDTAASNAAWNNPDCVIANGYLRFTDTIDSVYCDYNYSGMRNDGTHYFSEYDIRMDVKNNDDPAFYPYFNGINSINYNRETTGNLHILNNLDNSGSDVDTFLTINDDNYYRFGHIWNATFTNPANRTSMFLESFNSTSLKSIKRYPTTGYSSAITTPYPLRENLTFHVHDGGGIDSDDRYYDNMLIGYYPNPFPVVEFDTLSADYPSWSDNSSNNTEINSEVKFSIFWNITDIFSSDMNTYIFGWHNGSNWTDDASSGDIETGVQSFSGTLGVAFEDYDSFEVDFSSNWTDAYTNGNPFGDTDDWTRDSAGTGSGSTGPCSGSSSGTDCGALSTTWYIYVETSSGNCDTDGEDATVWKSQAINFDISSGEQITWWNNMYGRGIGTLVLEENTTGSWIELWSMTGDQGVSWFSNTTDLSSLTGSGNLRLHYTCAGGFYGDVSVDEINITGLGGTDTNSNLSAVTYNSIITETYSTINSVNVSIYVSYYNTSGSIANSNTNATLGLQIYNGSDWLDEGDFLVNETGFYTKSITTLSVLDNWGDIDNRNIKVNARYMDYNDATHFDKINWTEVEVNVSSNQYYLNDSVVSFTQDMCDGVSNKYLCWSNITKRISSTVDEEIEWYIWADTTNSFTNLTDTFIFNTTSSAPVDTCTCPGDSSAHEFDMSDACDVSSCTAGAVTFTGSGSIRCNGTWNIDSLGDPGSGGTLWMDSECFIDE